MRLPYLAGALLVATLAAAQTAPLKLVPEVPFVPTPDAVVEGMLKLANVQSSDTVYDLGCGDGRIVIMAAKKYGAQISATRPW